MFDLGVELGRPRRMTMAEIHIHIIMPTAAPSEP